MVVQTLKSQLELVVADEPDIDTRIRTLVDQLNEKIDKLGKLMPVPGQRVQPNLLTED